jgi:hypothetical protein
VISMELRAVILTLLLLASFCHADPAQNLPADVDTGPACVAGTETTSVDITMEPSSEPALSRIRIFVYTLNESYVKEPIAGGGLFILKITTQTGGTTFVQPWRVTSGPQGNVSFSYDPTAPDEQEACVMYVVTYCPLVTDGAALTSCFRVPDSGFSGSFESFSSYSDVTEYLVSTNPPPTVPLSHPTHLPSQGSVFYCNKNSANLTTLCWPLLVILTLLMGAMFASGHNPFGGFDFSSPRLSRGKPYQLKPKSMSIDVTSVAMAANKLTSVMFTLKEGGTNKVGGTVVDNPDGTKSLVASDKNGKQTVVGTVRADGKTVTNAAGKPIGTLNGKGQIVDAKGKVKGSVGGGEFALKRPVSIMGAGLRPGMFDRIGGFIGKQVGAGVKKIPVIGGAGANIQKFLKNVTSKGPGKEVLDKAKGSGDKWGPGRVSLTNFAVGQGLKPGAGKISPLSMRGGDRPVLWGRDKKTPSQLLRESDGVYRPVFGGGGSPRGEPNRQFGARGFAESYTLASPMFDGKWFARLFGGGGKKETAPQRKGLKGLLDILKSEGKPMGQEILSRALFMLFFLTTLRGGSPIIGKLGRFKATGLMRTAVNIYAFDKMGGQMWLPSIFGDVYGGLNEGLFTPSNAESKVAMFGDKETKTKEYAKQETLIGSLRGSIDELKKEINAEGDPTGKLHKKLDALEGKLAKEVDKAKHMIARRHLEERIVKSKQVFEAKNNADAKKQFAERKIKFSKKEAKKLDGLEAGKDGKDAIVRGKNGKYYVVGRGEGGKISVSEPTKIVHVVASYGADGRQMGVFAAKPGTVGDLIDASQAVARDLSRKHEAAQGKVDAIYDREDVTNLTAKESDRLADLERDASIAKFNSDAAAGIAERAEGMSGAADWWLAHMFGKRNTDMNSLIASANRCYVDQQFAEKVHEEQVAGIEREAQKLDASGRTEDAAAKRAQISAERTEWAGLSNGERRERSAASIAEPVFVNLAIMREYSQGLRIGQMAWAAVEGYKKNGNLLADAVKMTEPDMVAYENASSRLERLREVVAGRLSAPNETDTPSAERQERMKELAPVFAQIVEIQDSPEYQKGEYKNALKNVAGGQVDDAVNIWLSVGSAYTNAAASSARLFDTGFGSAEFVITGISQADRNMEQLVAADNGERLWDLEMGRMVPSFELRQINANLKSIINNCDPDVLQAASSADRELLERGMLNTYALTIQGMAQNTHDGRNYLVLGTAAANELLAISHTLRSAVTHEGQEYNTKIEISEVREIVDDSLANVELLAREVGEHGPLQLVTYTAEGAGEQQQAPSQPETPAAPEQPPIDYLAATIREMARMPNIEDEAEHLDEIRKTKWFRKELSGNEELKQQVENLQVDMIIQTGQGDIEWKAITPDDAERAAAQYLESKSSYDAKVSEITGGHPELVSEEDTHKGYLVTAFHGARRGADEAAAALAPAEAGTYRMDEEKLADETVGRKGINYTMPRIESWKAEIVQAPAPQPQPPAETPPAPPATQEAQQQSVLVPLLDMRVQTAYAQSIADRGLELEHRIGMDVKTGPMFQPEYETGENGEPVLVNKGQIDEAVKMKDYIGDYVHGKSKDAGFVGAADGMSRMVDCLQTQEFWERPNAQAEFEQVKKAFGSLDDRAHTGLEGVMDNMQGFVDRADDAYSFVVSGQPSSVRHRFAYERPGEEISSLEGILYAFGPRLHGAAGLGIGAIGVPEFDRELYSNMNAAPAPSGSVAASDPMVNFNAAAGQAASYHDTYKRAQAIAERLAWDVQIGRDLPSGIAQYQAERWKKDGEVDKRLESALEQGQWAIQTGCEEGMLRVPRTQGDAEKQKASPPFKEYGMAINNYVAGMGELEQNKREGKIQQQEYEKAKSEYVHALVSSQKNFTLNIIGPGYTGGGR